MTPEGVSSVLVRRISIERIRLAQGAQAAVRPAVGAPARWCAICAAAELSGFADFSSPSTKT
jgi:hypothetical protein